MDQGTGNHGRRVLSGMAAHLYAQLVTVLTQMASLPLFLARWSAQEYGQWLILSAIPVYLALADAGLLTAAGNRMTMARAAGRLDEVNRLFRHGLSALLVLLPAVAVVLAGLLCVFDFGMTPSQRLALALLGASALLTVACGLFDAAYRSFGQYPRVTVLLTSARLLEWVGTLAGIYLQGSLAAAAFGFLAGRAAACVVLFALARRDLPELRWTAFGVRARDVADLMRSGFGFVAFPVGTLLTLQGMVLLVGAQFGAVAVATFNVSRTLSRLITQWAVLTGKALAPEISALHGQGRRAEAAALSAKVARGVIPGALALGVLMGLAGERFIQIWGRGKIAFDAPLFWLLVAAALASAWWQIVSVRLTATNNHGALAGAFLGLSVGALGLAWLGAGTLGVRGAGLAALACESGMVLATWAVLRSSGSALLSSGRAP